MIILFYNNFWWLEQADFCSQSLGVRRRRERSSAELTRFGAAWEQRVAYSYTGPRIQKELQAGPAPKPVIVVWCARQAPLFSYFFSSRWVLSTPAMTKQKIFINITGLWQNQSENTRVLWPKPYMALTHLKRVPMLWRLTQVSEHTVDWSFLCETSKHPVLQALSGMPPQGPCVRVLVFSAWC